MVFVGYMEQQFYQKKALSIVFFTEIKIYFVVRQCLGHGTKHFMSYCVLIKTDLTDMFKVKHLRKYD